MTYVHVPLITDISILHTVADICNYSRPRSR